jgi:hypothetical protein
MTLLVETPHGAIRNLLPDGRDAVAWHAALSAEIATHLSPAHAAILATPVPVTTGIRWEAAAAQAIRYPELPSPDRPLLMRAVAVILSDIRRLAESGTAPAVARCWPMLREIPELGLLFAADGRPVLAGWGAVPQSVTAPRRLLADADDGRAWRAPPRTPWRLYAAVAAALAVFALASGLLLSRLAVPPASVAACAVAPDDLAALDGQAQADARHGALQAELARLVEEAGRRRLQCPLPVAARPPPPHAEAPPTPPPALPSDRWNRHDLSMLEGCWSRISNMVVRSVATGRPLSVANWRLCFDRAGHGTQTITLREGGRCTGSVQATFDDERVLMRATRCTGPGFFFVRSQQDCTRTSDEEATCIGRDLEGPGVGRGIDESQFRR